MSLIDGVEAGFEYRGVNRYVEPPGIKADLGHYEPFKWVIIGPFLEENDN